jgi:hypothetical protein
MEMARLYGFGRDGRFEKVRVWRVARGGRGKEREARDGGRAGRWCCVSASLPSGWIAAVGADLFLCVSFFLFRVFFYVF